MKQTFSHRRPSPFRSVRRGRFSINFHGVERWRDYAGTLKVPAAMPVILAQHKSRLLIIASALLLWAMAGCGGSHPDIVGKWRTAADSTALVWEFSTDGSVLMGSTQGRYSFGDRNRVKIETRFGISVYQMEFSGDRMILRDPSGSKLEFTRSK